MVKLAYNVIEKGVKGIEILTAEEAINSFVEKTIEAINREILRKKGIKKAEVFITAIDYRKILSDGITITYNYFVRYVKNDREYFIASDMLDISLDVYDILYKTTGIYNFIKEI